VNPDPAFRLYPAALIEMREDRGEYYLVPPAMTPALTGEYITASIYTAINRQGVLFLWPVRDISVTDSKNVLDWRRSMMEAAQLATTHWVRVIANMSLGAYTMFTAPDDLPDPVWPTDLSFKEMLRTAFRDRYVDTPDHPIVKRLLRGGV
jgi:hypothetical protein